MTRALGVDPGFASTGVAALERLSDGSIASRGVRLITTQKNAAKTFDKLRASVDDERRVNEVWREIDEMVGKWKPHVIGVEAYHVFDPKDSEALRAAAQSFMQFVGGGSMASAGSAETFISWMRTNFEGYALRLSAVHEALKMRSTIAGRGQAAKTMLIYGAVLAIAYAHKTPVYPFLPLDLKVKLAKKRGATKADVAHAMVALVPNLADAVHDRIRATSKHEHLYDATGHAYLALIEYERQRAAFVDERGGETC